MTSVKCPHCHQWIGPMELHEDCARKQDEGRTTFGWICSCGHCNQLANRWCDRCDACGRAYADKDDGHASRVRASLDWALGAWAKTLEKLR